MDTACTARFSKKSPWSVFFHGEMSVAMLASLEKKHGIKLKYKVRNNKKTKLSNKKQKNT
jgi:hypothetical protein